MPEREKVYIFHVFRKDGSSLILHPFTAEKVVGLLEKHDLEGRYGGEPRVEALTLFRNDLYRMIEAGVRLWMNDVRFIPKFLLSTGAFLVTYLFMSYVVRDPVPVIDELVVGLAAGVTSYLLLGRRDMASTAATRKRLDLRVKVDRVVFRESGFVRRVETELHRHETDRIEEVIGRIVAPVQQQLGEEAHREAGQFLQMLESRFNFKKLQREERHLKRYIRGGRSPSELKKLMESRKLDFPLYAVYKSFKRSMANSK